MRDLPALDGDVVEIDGRGRCAVPGLVDCHTHACFAGDRVDEFSLRSAGASYEELHAAGGGILSTVRATRAAGEAALRNAVERHRGWMHAHGTTTFEAKSGYGLDRDTELAQLHAIAAAGGIPTWLGAHAVPPEFDSADAYLDFALAEVLPEAATIAEAADVFLERGAFDAAQARRYLEACAAAGPRAPPARRPVHGVRRDPARSRARGALGRPSRGHRARRRGGARGERRRRRPAARRARSSSAGRCRPRGRSSTRARPSRSPPTSTPAAPSARACRSSARSRARSSACPRPRRSRACTVNAAHVLGRADRKGRLAPGYDADIVAPRRRRLALPRLPPRRRRRRRGGRRRRGTLASMATKKQRRRREKGRRHEYEIVYVDSEGQEVEVEEPEEKPREERKPTSGIKPTAATKSKQPAAKPSLACRPRRRPAVVGADAEARGDLRADHADLPLPDEAEERVHRGHRPAGPGSSSSC